MKLNDIRNVLKTKRLNMKINKPVDMTAHSFGEDHYKKIFDTICNKDNYITKVDILDCLHSAGIVNDDPRIIRAGNQLLSAIKPDKIKHT